MKILVTGAAGFIGFHLARSLLISGHYVFGIDNINNYYDDNLKYDRLKELGINKNKACLFLNTIQSDLHKNFFFQRINIQDKQNIPQIFKTHKFDLVCNLAAQAGVRYSIQNPQAYIDSNINGFFNILECCRVNKIKKLVYASSSSVYGNSKKTPFKEGDSVDLPISLYAATKKTNELMAHAYSNLYGIETIGLRFFTVYGPWGRPDMAIYLLTDAILKNKSINVFNHGQLSRDYTYIDDIIEGVKKTILEQTNNMNLYKIYNIGNGKSINLLEFIKIIEKLAKKISIKKMMKMQPGDVEKTFASTELLKRDYNYSSNTDVEKGVSLFYKWFLNYYKIEN